VHGHVLQEDCQTGISGTVVELWQADVDGTYHGADCRGYITTDQNGLYEFSTVHPGRYAIDHKEQLFRPRHIHFKVHGGSYHVGVVTQMYFTGDPYLGEKDACQECSSGKKELRTKPRLFCDNHLCIAIVKFDIVLRRKPFDRQILGNMFNVVKERNE
jgi:protocatechuate 3,4-dioxygenase beta subunit